MLSTTHWISAFLFWGFAKSFVLLGEEERNQNALNVFADDSLPQNSLFFDVILPESHGIKAKGLNQTSGMNQSSNQGKASHVLSKTIESERQTQNAGTSTASKTLPKARLSQKKKSRKMIIKKRRSPSVRYPTQPRRRGLADTGLGLNGVASKNPWNSLPPEKPGIYISPMPGSGGINGDTADDLYTYTFVEDNKFELRGSASINFDGVDKFRITFEYSITGDGNATAHLVTPEQEAKFPAWDENGIGSTLSRPNSCHLQASENRTEPVENCPTKQPNTFYPVQGDSGTPPPRRIGARRSRVQPGTDTRYPFLDDQYSFLTSSLMSPYGPSLSESFIFPNQPVPSFNLNPQVNEYVNKKCDVTTSTYVRKWLCIGRTAPPCFMMLMQGSKYKVVKKICPQRVYAKNLI
ncbi:uncharacterized protein LOC120342237 [Styela clava]